jgi:predicted nucleic acid-binding protein
METAADLAKIHAVRTLDALHLAASHRVGGTTFPFVTYDLRQGQAARALGMTVLGT